MELSPSDWTQLISALALGVVFFVVAYVAPARYSVALLILLAPFQIISSRYGTVNMALIYVVGLAHLFRGRIRALPLIGIFGLIMLAYLLSFTQTHPATYLDHALYLVGIVANIVLFYVVYNYARLQENVRPLLYLFVAMNALILLYCVVQLITGYERFAFLGVSEFEFAEMSESRQRLLGPFGSPGTNGEVFVLQILLMAYLWLHQPRGTLRNVLVAMMVANLGFLIMTGSRGSFLTLLGSGLLFLWFFRERLGFGRVLRIAMGWAAALALISAIVLNYTQFNILYERLSGTELREGLPDTRALAFRFAWEKIPEKIFLGHGPQLRLIDERNRVIPGHEFLHFPHNLYLFLALTVGIVGLFAWMLLFWSFYAWWRRARVRLPPRGDPFHDGLPTLAVLLLVAFLVDQLKIEFLRSQFTDHQQYMFALWAILLGATSGVRQKEALPVQPGVVPAAPR
jgi:O-antigen ligase